MPRIAPSVFRAARRIDPLLVPLLPVLRSIQSAQTELFWLRQAFNDDYSLYKAVHQRSKFVPLQYILGDQPFLNLNIKCSPAALIPRWETEEWVHKVLSQLRFKNLKVVDACTGTGCIALSFAKDHQVQAFDIDSETLKLAQENQVFNNVKNVNWHKIDLLNEDEKLLQLAKGVQLIVSNPPYIPIKEYLALDKSVKNYEPKIALVGNMEFYRALVDKTLIPNELTCDGFVFEVGNLEQIEFVKRRLVNNSWNIGCLLDSDGKYRCVLGWKNSIDFSNISTMT